MPNPFFFAGKITNPDNFVGREKELKSIFGCLNTTHTGQIQHVSVVGARRIGKSSLLYRVSQVYAQHLTGNHQQYRFIFLDLDNPNCHSQDGLLSYILQKLDLPHPAQPKLERFYELIENLNQKKKIWPVFLMDEFEHLPERPDHFKDDFYEALRSLGGNNLAGIVTASQSPLRDLAKQGKLTSPFFNIFHRIDLAEFTPDETQVFLERGRQCDWGFTDKDCKQIVKLAGRHPARLQVVSSFVYQAKEGQKPFNWKDIKLESYKQPAFEPVPDRWPGIWGGLVKALKCLFISLPQSLGRAFLDFINRDKATDTTALFFGYFFIFLGLGVLIGIIPWSVVTKYVKIIFGLLPK